MMRVKLEIWMAMGGELGEEFHSPSELRSEMDVDVEEGKSVREFFVLMAERYRPIGERVFNGRDGDFYSNVVVTFNDRVIRRENLHDRILKDGDTIRVMQVHSGG
jgi:molybdopterin converting factor small subunit